MVIKVGGNLHGKSSGCNFSPKRHSIEYTESLQMALNCIRHLHFTGDRSGTLVYKEFRSGTLETVC